MNLIKMVPNEETKEVAGSNIPTIPDEPATLSRSNSKHGGIAGFLGKLFQEEAKDIFVNLKSRRATYHYQDTEDGSLDNMIAFFYCVPAFSRNPLLLLIRYFIPATK
jgi:hypothetical protein